jgi:hypothetical protein
MWNANATQNVSQSKLYIQPKSIRMSNFKKWKIHHKRNINFMYYVLHKATLNPLRNNILIKKIFFFKNEVTMHIHTPYKEKNKYNQLKDLKKVWHFNKICTFEIYIINSIANNTFWISKIRPFGNKQRNGWNSCSEIA